MGYIVMGIKGNQKVTALYKQGRAHSFMNLLSWEKGNPERTRTGFQQWVAGNRIKISRLCENRAHAWGNEFLKHHSTQLWFLESGKLRLIQATGMERNSSKWNKAKTGAVSLCCKGSIQPE